jgi:outer membrane protein assembly factor BamD
MGLFVRRISVLIIVFLLASGCTKFQKIRKSPDWRVKYEAAVKYYEEEDYYRANLLFEDIIPVIRGTEEAELANFYFAYSYFHQKQYILSAHYFESFVTIYSRSDFAMEAAYMHAYSLYMQSPVFRLDQTPTYQAIGSFQKFINKYPYSEYAQQADDLIDELQVKLETKAFENAKLYYKIESYKAAMVAFDNFRIDFPDSRFQEEVAYLSIKAAYDFAQVSIQSRQKERYTQAIEYYEKFIDKYPSSSFQKDAESIYADCVEELTNFADQNNL